MKKLYIISATILIFLTIVFLVAYSYLKSHQIAEYELKKYLEKNIPIYSKNGNCEIVIFSPPGMMDSFAQYHCGYQPIEEPQNLLQEYKNILETKGWESLQMFDKHATFKKGASSYISIYLNATEHPYSDSKNPDNTVFISISKLPGHNL